MAEAISKNRDIKVIDAAGRAVGRVASEAAGYLIGKHLKNFAPNLDRGAFVHIKNSGQSVLTGKKIESKTYKWYTGYQGGLKSKKASEVRAKDPAEVIRRAVKNMLPKNSHQTPRMRRLRITN
jgi:large subunit ribosomal protein L13